MVRKLLLYPFFFSFYPVLFLFSKNIAEVPLEDLWGPLGGVFIYAIVLLLISRVILGSQSKAALFTAVFMLLILSFGHIKQVFLNAELQFIGVKPITRYVLWILCLFAIPVTMAGGILYRIKEVPKALSDFLNLLGLTLIILVSVPIVMHYLNPSDLKSSSVQTQSLSTDPEKTILEKPDIYYFILDGYGGASSLKKFYHFDNQEFLKALSAKGFYVANESYSNYYYTLQSLASSLNFNYLDNLLKQEKNEMGVFDWALYGKLIRDNQTVGFLKELGYEYFHFGSSGFSPTRENPHADQNFNQEKINDFERMLLATSIVSRAEAVVTSYDRRENVLQTFEKLKEVSGRNAPMFSFIHFILPHPPYIFQADGEAYSFFQLAVQEGSKKAKHYVDQTEFTNKKLLETIDHILANSKRPVVIILQGDHGPRPEWRGVTGGAPDPSDEDGFQELLEETFPILNAYYVSEELRDQLYPNVSPVNSFRFIFNHYFNANMPILEEQHHYPTSKKGFLDVTEKIS